MYDDEKTGGAPAGVCTGSAELRELRRAGHVGPRRAPGPRPVRPATVRVPVRPAQGERPVPQIAPEPGPAPAMQRTLVRRPLPAPAGVASPVRRFADGVAVAAVSAVVVVLLGLLAAAVDASRAAEMPATVSAGMVTVGSEQTVWDVARRVAPGADGPTLSVVAERIVETNDLTSGSVRPGQVLRIPTG